MSPAPSSVHQDASRHIPYQLYEHIDIEGLSKVYDAPMDLQRSNTGLVHLDLIVILRKQYHIVSASRIIRAPDLLGEITSPTTAGRDWESRTLAVSAKRGSRVLDRGSR